MSTTKFMLFADSAAMGHCLWLFDVRPLTITDYDTDPSTKIQMQSESSLNSFLTWHCARAACHLPSRFWRRLDEEVLRETRSYRVDLCIRNWTRWNCQQFVEVSTFPGSSRWILAASHNVALCTSAGGSLRTGGEGKESPESKWICQSVSVRIRSEDADVSLENMLPKCMIIIIQYFPDFHFVFIRGEPFGEPVLNFLRIMVRS